ncbi:MAG: transposase [Gammaproteobacteria bacterium RIFCSPHIGHO2_12_FULL_42_13]|nr:MAG: transposase [Gammaproteobacteria bacterium RIFCSPHIGHO2_12_FULL_42_13]
MLRAHKIELRANNKQATYFAKACGTARKAYNWALEEWQKQYQAGGKPTEAALRRQLNSIKRKEFPWMLEVTKNAPQMAIMQLGDAFKNFFLRRANHPTFRKKWIDDRFTLTNDQFAVNDSRIRIPRLGWMRMRESLRYSGKIVSATISHRANKWFVSITVEMQKPIPPAANDNQVAVGVDLGLTDFAVLSTGEKITGPKPHQALMSRLKRLSKSLSRKEKKSNNRKKAKIKLARLHYRIANIRSNAQHQLTTRLVNDFDVIGVEDLHVKGMLKNRKLSRSIADMGFHEFRRQLEYKTLGAGKKLVVADRWFASSKICSCCGEKVDGLLLSEREWTCVFCSTHHDRDINAAMNLKKLAVSSTVSACGASSDGAIASVIASHGAMKQESNVKVTYG